MVSSFKCGGIAEAMAAANRVSTLPHSLAMPAALAAGIFAFMPENVRAQAATPVPQTIPEVVVTGTRSVPPAIARETPAVTESVEREQIAQSINASDSEDVLKYLPGLHVRKRYSGRMYNTLDNSDTNGSTYTGSSRFFVMDARMLWRIDKQWSAALGVDNLTNAIYWAFHPYPQRTWVAELRFAL